MTNEFHTSKVVNSTHAYFFKTDFAVDFSLTDELEELQTQLLTMPGEGFFYTYLTNFSDNLVTFDNLTIRHKQGTLRNIHEYYPYGLEYWHTNRMIYDRGNQYSEFHHRERQIDGIEMNRFAARWYDPVIARWHAPDPLEQMHSPYVALCNDPANFVDPDGRAGRHMNDFLGFTGVIVGGAVLAGIGQKLQGAKFAGSLVQGITNFVTTIKGWINILKNVYSSSKHYGCMDEISIGKFDVVEGQITNHGNSGGNLRECGKSTSNSSSAEASSTKPIIYLVNELKNVALDIPLLMTEMQNILGLNGFANMFDIVEITHQQALDMNRNKTFRTCDAYHTLRDGTDFGDIDKGNTLLNPLDSTPDFLECYTNVALCENIQTVLRTCGQKSSLEHAVAIVTVHELSHQYTNRMYSYLYGYVPIIPQWLDSRGHLNSVPNLLNDGQKWLTNLQEECGQYSLLLKLRKSDHLLFRSYHHCSQLNLQIGDYQAWRREFMKFCNNYKK